MHHIFTVFLAERFVVYDFGGFCRATLVTQDNWKVGRGLRRQNLGSPSVLTEARAVITAVKASFRAS